MADLKCSTDRQVGRLREGGYKVMMENQRWVGTVGGVRGRCREQIWRLREEQKDKERRELKLPGVCQQHVTGVGVHYSTGFAYRVYHSLSMSLSLFCRHKCVQCVRNFARKRFILSLFVLSLSSASKIFPVIRLKVSQEKPWSLGSVMASAGFISLLQ